MILKVCPTVTLTISMNTIPVRSRNAKYDQVWPAGHSRAKYDPVWPSKTLLEVANCSVISKSVVFVSVGQTENCKLVTKAKLR